MYAIFDALINQFGALLSKNNYYSNEYDFNEFFEKSDRYLSDVLINSNGNSRILIIILCMIGLLPFEKQCFNRNNQFSNGFENRIMSHVRKDFSMVCESMYETEWVLFKRGLATFLCIELLYHGPNSSNDNKIAFLQEIPDEIKRQEFANQLLYQLHKLDQPIFGDLKWIDLLAIVDPTKIQIGHLNLTNSFETFTRPHTLTLHIIGFIQSWFPIVLKSGGG
jgi:hypothetical protein